MRMTIVAWLLALALIGCVACDLAGPETVPVDPGRVVALVTDESGAPLRDVWVYVHDIPNHVGTTYTVGSPTNATGVVTIESIPAGTRRVEVKPPAAYTGAALTVSVDVFKGLSTSVTFVLTRRD